MTKNQKEKNLEQKLGERLLFLLKEQRKYFIRTIDGGKIISNPIVYNSLEDELFKVQEKIGRESKKRIIAECQKKGWPLPNFRKEGIAKR